VRVEITVVSDLIIFVRFNITLRVEMTLCVYKSHSACGKYNLRVESTLRVEITLYIYIYITLVRVKIKLVRVNTVCVLTHKSDFYTQSVVLTRISVRITFVSVIITFVSVIITLIRVNITLYV
jgi:hypothetical protein